MDTRGWLDQGTPWMLKLSRARKHRDDLREAIRRYLATDPYRLEYDPGEQEHVTRVTFRIASPVPPDLSLVVGDVLHNLRSALDAFAFELARSHFGPDLEDNERIRKASAFPVVVSQEELMVWFQAGGKPRASLFGIRELRALHWAQSSYWREQASYEVASVRNLDEVRALDPLSRLERLHNMDKHRRLVLAGFSLDLLSRGTSGDAPSARRVVNVPRPPWTDGQRVATIYDPPSEAVDLPLVWNLQLGLADDLPDQSLESALGSMAAAVEGAISGGLQSLGTMP